MATILIVDDHPISREFLVTILRYAGHDLFEAGSGEEALRTARAVRPDLVITDALMPGMDGYELARALKRDPSLKGTAVALHTATFSEVEARDRARSCGADAVIAKPSEPREICSAVDALLALRPSRAAGRPSRAAGRAPTPPRPARPHR